MDTHTHTHIHIHTHIHAHRTTTVTLAVHAHQGLTSTVTLAHARRGLIIIMCAVPFLWGVYTISQYRQVTLGDVVLHVTWYHISGDLVPRVPKRMGVPNHRDTRDRHSYINGDCTCLHHRFVCACQINFLITVEPSLFAEPIFSDQNTNLSSMFSRLKASYMYIKLGRSRVIAHLKYLVISIVRAQAQKLSTCSINV